MTSYQLQAARDAVSTVSTYDTILESLPNPRKNSNKRLLSVKDVGFILGSCAGLKNNTGGNNLSLTGSVTLSVKDDVALDVIRLCTWDQAGKAVEAGELKEFLCVLSTYRMLQKKLQVINYLFIAQKIETKSIYISFLLSIQ